MGVRFLLLGVAQDAGVPQLGCTCPNCTAVLSGDMPPQYAVSAAIIDDTEKLYWLLDCGPDFKQQYQILQQHTGGYQLGGVLLTHLHMGHYWGLVHFGREAMGAHGVQVWGTPSVCAFLQNNQPWRNYVEAGTFKLHPTNPDWRASLQLTSGVQVTPVPVPHRAEFSDCVAYRIKGPTKQVFYCPDIDSWEKWEALGTSVQAVVEGVDHAFLDACFYDASEMPGRDIKEIPHPLIVDTISRLSGPLACKVVLVHMNHSNPVYRDGEERAACIALEFQLGQQGTVYNI